MVAPRLSTVPTGFAPEPPIGDERTYVIVWRVVVSGGQCSSRSCVRSSPANDELVLFGSAWWRWINSARGQPADDAPWQQQYDYFIVFADDLVIVVFGRSYER